MRHPRILFSFVLFLCVISCSTAGIGEETSKENQTPQQSFGSLQPYAPTDNALLPQLLGKQEGDGTNDSEDRKEQSARPNTESSKAEHHSLKVRNYGDLKHIVFEGATFYPVEEIRRGLGCDLKFQAAARPSADAIELMTTLEQRLQHGYRHCGCPDASVIANFDSEREAILVRIKEGQQFRRGAIRVSGLPDAESLALVRSLTAPQSQIKWKYLVGDETFDTFFERQQAKNRGRYGELEGTAEALESRSSVDDDSRAPALWESGEVFDFCQPGQSQLQQWVRLALLKRGYFANDIHTELIRDASKGTVDLLITVPQNTPAVLLGKIEASGLKRDSREALIEYLKIAVGDRLDADALTRLSEKLRDSCRYWTYQVAVSLPAAAEDTARDGAQAELRLTLEEYAPAAPLSEPLSPTHEALRKSAKWIESLNSNFGDQDLVCNTEAVNAGVGLQMAQAALAADGTLALRGLFTSTLGWRADHSLVAGPNRIEIYDWRGKTKFVVSPEATLRFELSVLSGHDDQGEQNTSFWMGYAMTSKGDKSHPYIEITAEPAAMLRFADIPNTETKLQDGVLTLHSQAIDLELDATTGAVRSIKSAELLSAGFAAVDFKLESGFVANVIGQTRQKGAEFANGHDDGNPWGSTSAYLIRQLQRQPAVEKSEYWRNLIRISETAVRSPRVRERLKQLSADFCSTNAAGGTKFWIPASTNVASPKGYLAIAAFYAPYCSDEAFPHGSWPWTLSREAAFRQYAGGGADASSDAFSEKAQDELSRLLASGEMGPVGYLLMALVLKEQLRDERLPTVIATFGLRDLSDDAFLKDVHLITRGDHLAAVVCREAVEECDKLSEDDREAILNALPAEFSDTISQLFSRRREKPGEPVEEAIEGFAREAWHRGVKADVESGLRELTATVAAVPETESSTR